MEVQKSLRVAVIVALAIGVRVAPTAVYAADSLPAAVAAGLKEIASMCSEAGGKPNTSSAVKRADLNADGHEDFVLDVGAIECEGAASIYGDREKVVTVYLGDGKGGAVSAYTDSVFGAKIEGSGADAKLWLTVSGERCGKKPSADFASENFCDRALAWNTAAKKLEYAPVATARMIQ